MIWSDSKRPDWYFRYPYHPMLPPCSSILRPLYNRGTPVPRDFCLPWCHWRNYMSEAEQHQPVVNWTLVDWGAVTVLFNCHHHGWVEAVGHAEFEVVVLQKYYLNKAPHLRIRAAISIFPSDTICKKNDSTAHVRRQKTYPVEVFWIKLQFVIVVLKLISKLLTGTSFPEFHIKTDWLKLAFLKLISKLIDFNSLSWN